MGADFLLAVGGFFLGILGTFLSVDKSYRERRDEFRQQLRDEKERYAEAKTKEYAAQRDFGHLQKSLEQLSLGQAQIVKELELENSKLSTRLDRLENKVDNFICERIENK